MTKLPKTDDSRNFQWKRMSFKGNKVWAAYDSNGSPILKKNKILIKYNLHQDYEYLIHPKSLKNVDQAVPACAKGKTGTKKESNTSSGSRGNDLPENCICIYTDGASSGNPGPSGIGVLFMYKEHRKEISEFIGTATNNIAELKAIQKALSTLKRNDLPVRIFTDSAYCIGVLTEDNQSRANQGIILDIKAIMKGFKDISFVKVEGHSGIKENEVADFLATSAVKKRSP